MKKLNWLGNLILIVLVAGSLTGCTVTRMMEISAGIGVNKTETGTEKQTSEKVTKKEVALSFTPIGDGLGLRLQYRPHHEVQSRSIMQYEGRSGVFSTLIGIAEFGALAFATAKWVQAVNDSNDDNDNNLSQTQKIKEKWSDLKTWQQAAIISVPLDYLLWTTIANNFRPTKRTPWEPSGDTEPGKLVGISNHPLNISLPQLGYTGSFHTNADGQLTISAHDLIGKISGQELGTILREDSIKVDASANVDGEEQKQSFTMTRSSPLFRTLYQEANKRR